MLFSPKPKTKREELFDRKNELQNLSTALEMYPITLVTGLRRVGKSSIVRVFLNESSAYYIYIDGRRVYEISSGSMGSYSLYRVLESEFARLSKSRKFLNFLKRVRGINIAGNGIEIERKEFDLSMMFESFDRFAKKEKKKFIIFFDEAQYFRFYGSRGGRDILALLSLVYDNMENIRVIITGSEVGILHDFLRLDDYDSPLYGRPIYTIAVQPFSHDLSVEFLKKGFEEAKLDIDFDIEEVVSKIDGIPGYLVMSGLKYIETRDAKRALEEVFLTIKALFEKELSELDKRSKRYRIILKLIASGVKSWSNIKRYFNSVGDHISDSRLSSLLNNLEKMSLIEKAEEGYKITDVVLSKIMAENS